jgi:hypothetical protein
LQIEMRPTDGLIAYVRNARTHSDEQVAQIAASIAEFGFVNPILVGADDVVIAGHGRLMAAKRLGMAEVPAVVIDHLSDAQRRALVIADNKLAENAGWDESMLRAEIAALQDESYDLDLLGFAEDELGQLLDAMETDATGAEVEDGAGEAASEAQAQVTSTLAGRFGVPPFSVLEARKGWWQDRKRAWIDLGIWSELGRGAAPGGSPQPLDRARMDKANATPGGSPMPAMNYSKTKARGDGRGRSMGEEQ